MSQFITIMKLHKTFSYFRHAGIIKNLAGISFVIFIPAFLNLKSLHAQQEDLNVLGNWVEFSDSPNSLYRHLSAQACSLLKNRSDEISRIKTLDAWQARQKNVRLILNNLMGPFPPKTPLNARVLKTIENKNYRIEHIVFESQPGFYVTSSLFIPKGLKGKAPVIIYCSGHTEEGYRSPVYQYAILNLVSKNFIVFAFDPVGQGERKEYYDPDSGNSKVGRATREHSYAGAQAFIAGSSEARYMIFDGIRAIDYLVSRKEVDPARIGITGRSGGGTQSAYIAAFDERIHASAPECYITNFTRLIQSIGPQDAEQNFYHGITGGIDHPDLLEIRAPKPALMITTTNDFFSIQGARETEKEVSLIYKAYGKEGNFRQVEDIMEHASTQKNRIAMYNFFQEHLNNPGNADDEQVELLSPEELKVTETGQVSSTFHGETIFSLNAKESEKLRDKLNVSRQNIQQHLSSIISEAKVLSGFLEPGTVEEPVFAGRYRRDGYLVEKYFLKGEGEYFLPYLLMVPDHPNNKAVIYLHPSGKKSEAAPGGKMEWMARQGFVVMVPDLPGTGELGSGTFIGDSDFELNDEKVISYNIWFASVLTGRSIVGLQAGDVRRLTRALKEHHGVNEIYGVAEKSLSPLLMHISAFDHSIVRVALIGPYTSYASIVMNRFYNPGFIFGTVAGALTAYDLPDLAASLAPRKLMMINVTDGMGEPAPPELIEKELSFVKTSYSSKQADDNLVIRKCESKESILEALSEWLK
ncbi:MAG TPA: acetylxylan esterase [Cyclobacteriaceae bacterium]|nr:acetylxylan esterase [Cyclobacteriaceae bacterium]